MVRYTFFQRLGHHDVCVVPARVLSAEPTHDEDPSRQPERSAVSARLLIGSPGAGK